MWQPCGELRHFGVPRHRSDPRKAATLWKGETSSSPPPLPLAKPLGGGTGHTRDPAAGGVGPSAPRPGREHPHPPAAPLTPPHASEEQRGWGEVANISISEEVTCDPKGGSIVPLLRGTQTLVSLSA